MSDNLASAYHPGKQALSSRTEELRVKKEWTKKKTCWKCQKDKPVAGGSLTVRPNFFKFICKQCCEAKKANNETSGGD